MGAAMFANDSRSTSIASVRSSLVVKRPMLNLREESSSVADSPIALSTCDGSGMPDVQAEPVDAATLG